MANNDPSKYTLRYNEVSETLEASSGSQWEEIDLSAQDTGITQLTGDVTAGPGSGSQAASLANTAVTPGSYTATNLTVDAKGRITAAANGSAGSTRNYVQNTTSSLVITTASASYIDTTFGVTITPSSISAAILVSFPNIDVYTTTTGTFGIFTIFRGIAGTDLSGGANVGFSGQDYAQNRGVTTSLEYIDVPGTTSPVTYELYVKIIGGGTIRVNDQQAKMVAIAQEIH